MKKKAREQAKKMYLKAKGQITHKKIADAVKVNPLTVGRWKREDNWESELRAPKPAARKATDVVIRKKTVHDKALNLYLSAGGNITNKDLARRVGVSPATISKWKDLDDWDSKIAEEQEKAPEPEKAEPELDMGKLASPGQIVRLNERIDGLLQLEHLTAGEVAELAAAKRDMLDAVEIYVAIARELGVTKS